MQLCNCIALRILCVKLNVSYIITMIFNDLTIITLYVYVYIINLIFKYFDL